MKSEMRRGIFFGHTLTLGHQSIYMEQDRYRAFMTTLGCRVDHPKYADDLFRAIGVTTLDVMDASAYEGANLIHDLNQPVDTSLHQRYDCLFDGGSLEHVFNFPVALKSCMEMVKVGGHLITILPANNYCGHGFYQFSPELFYGALSPDNGFLIERILFFFRDRWYSVRTPAEVQSRIEVFTGEPMQLFVSARRYEQKAILQEWPQQADYVRNWETDNTSPPAQPRRSAKDALLNVLPVFRRLQARWRTFKHQRRCSPHNRAFFTPTDLGEP
ncbi:MAG: hypothetical protein NTZ46_08840 [Verrucomicrobia bacterium]|nr:hypothetical protein [Verrucomicrobiota bacterium]